MAENIKKPLTANQRKKIERQRKREAGLVPKEVWIHPERADELKEMVNKLQKPPK